MSVQQFSSRRQAEEMLVSLAQRDAAFRAELVANPRAAIAKQMGVELPADLKISVVEETSRSLYLVLPAKSGSSDLSEQELATVVGGAAARSDATTIQKEANDAGKFDRKLSPDEIQLPAVQQQKAQF